MIVAYLATDPIKWYASQKETKFPCFSHKFPAWSWKVAPDWSISKWLFIFLRRVWLYIDCRVTLKRKIFGLSVENEFDSDIKEIDLVCSRIFSQHSCFLSLSISKWPFQPFPWAEILTFYGCLTKELETFLIGIILSWDIWGWNIFCN